MQEQAVSLLRAAIRAALDDSANGRIMTIMGPNGSGKSRLLAEVKRQLHGDQISSFLLPPVRRLNTGGAPEVPGFLSNLKVGNSRDTFSRLLDYLTEPPNANSVMAHIRQPKASIDTALIALLQSSFKFHEDRIAEYKEMLYQWDRGKGEKPVHPAQDWNTLLEHIGGILGYKIILADEDHPPGPLGQRRLTFDKNGTTFGLNELSDGEKQLALISIFLLQTSENKFVFLADEPELYMNESRAIAIWEKIEAQFPSAVFVHATHNLNFATRPTVSATHILKMSGELGVVDRTEPLPGSIVRDIVGARVQLARTACPAIFCEDNLSKTFLSDLFEGAGVELVPLSGCGTVIDAVSGERYWKEIRSEGSRYCGVIDRDMRDDAEVAALEVQGVFCLPVNEVESILLIPEIACKKISQSAGHAIGLQDYTSAVMQCASSLLHPTLQKLADHLQRRHFPKIKFIIEGGRISVKNINQPTELAAKFEERGNKIREAVERHDLDMVLKSFKGKKLYKAIRKHVETTFGVGFRAIRSNATMKVGLS